MRNTKPTGIKSIAILRTDRIGEVLLSTPIIEAMHRAFPGAQVTFITSPYSRDIVSDRPDLAGVLSFDTIERRVPLWEAFSLAGLLRKKRFDMAIILNPHRVLHLACFLAGIRYRLGFDRKWGFLLNRKARDKRQESKMHEVEYNLRLLKRIGIEQRNIPPFMPVLSKSAFYVGGILQQSGVSGKNKIIAVHPGSSNPKKRWPKENFRKLIKDIISTGSVDVVLIGDRDEKQLCNEISEGLGKSVHNLAGLFTIRKLTAFLKAVELLITNDNGPMHIAAACGTKVVAIFNGNLKGSNPTRWGPYGEGHTVLYKPMNEISVEEIYEAVKKILA